MMEETEYAFLRSRGLSVVLYDDRGTMGFPRLSASVEVHEPIGFDEAIEVQLRLKKLDGKQIVYVFDLINSTGVLAVKGRFKVACCRFPDRLPPYAILLPEFVVQALQTGDKP
jgi:acyl-CoA thioesterase FadM